MSSVSKEFALRHARIAAIAGAFRQARIAAKLTQESVALALGVSQPFVFDVEHGRRPLAEKYYAKLPAPIRDAVIDAAKGELRDRIARLDQIGKEPKDAGTGC